MPNHQIWKWWLGNITKNNYFTIQKGFLPLYMINLEQLGVHLPQGYLFQNITVQINKGDKIGLAGKMVPENQLY